MKINHILIIGKTIRHSYRAIQFITSFEFFCLPFIFILAILEFSGRKILEDQWCKDAEAIHHLPLSGLVLTMELFCHNVCI